MFKRIRAGETGNRKEIVQTGFEVLRKATEVEGRQGRTGRSQDMYKMPMWVLRSIVDEGSSGIQCIPWIVGATMQRAGVGIKEKSLVATESTLKQEEVW